MKNKLVLIFDAGDAPPEIPDVIVFNNMSDASDYFTAENYSFKSDESFGTFKIGRHSIWSHGLIRQAKEY